MLRTNVRIHQPATKAGRRWEVVTNGFNGLAGKRFHFIGVGGIGMSGLAMLLLSTRQSLPAPTRTPAKQSTTSASSART